MPRRRLPKTQPLRSFSRCTRVNVTMPLHGPELGFPSLAKPSDSEVHTKIRFELLDAYSCPKTAVQRHHPVNAGLSRIFASYTRQSKTILRARKEKYADT